MVGPASLGSSWRSTAVTGSQHNFKPVEMSSQLLPMSPVSPSNAQKKLNSLQKEEFLQSCYWNGYLRATAAKKIPWPKCWSVFLVAKINQRFQYTATPSWSEEQLHSKWKVSPGWGKSKPCVHCKTVFRSGPECPQSFKLMGFWPLWSHRSVILHWKYLALNDISCLYLKSFNLYLLYLY